MTSDPEGRALLTALDAEDLAACVLFGEGRGESSKGREAIACTFLNRVAQGRFGGHDLRRVLLRRWAYSAIEPSAGPDYDGDGLADNYETVLDVARTLGTVRKVERGEPILGVVPQIGPVLTDCLRIAREVARGTLNDFTGGSTHYCTVALLESDHPPAWTKGKKPTVIISNHAFFANID